MRSRSSRLFVVLLHLVGISNNLPNNPFKRGVGIIGVHPLSILLEPLELQAAGGLGELLALLESAGYNVDETVLNEPYWLQDDTDGTCLGPSGFSECGDATLWKVRRRPAMTAKRGKRRKRGETNIDMEGNKQTGFLASFRWSSSKGETENDSTEHEQLWEYALELADVNKSSILISGEHIDDSDNLSECVLSMQASGEENGILQMGSCASHEAWSWSIDEGGVLTWERNGSSIRAEKRGEFGAGMVMGGAITRFLDVTSTDYLDTSACTGVGAGAETEDCNNGEDTRARARCLWKTNDASAITAPCRPIDGDIDTDAKSQRSLVSFSVIQYQKSAAVSPQLPRFPRNQDHPNETEILSKGENNEENQKSQSQPNAAGKINVNTARESTNLPHLKRASESNVSRQETPQSSIRTPGLHLNTARHGHSSTFKTSTANNKENKNHHSIPEIRSPLGVGGMFERTFQEEDKKNSNLLHYPPSPVASPGHPHSHAHHEEIVHKPRKIPVNPYIEASKNSVYVDPVTGMSYPTCISEYLGHDRKEVGRHTLTGVGIYTRTMVKIKIYGIAFYVSKRDILNDPGFNDFAEMSSDELRQNDDFYRHLYRESGNFDRTLFIKLNMQLSTETVRQSLTGDWQLLTDEHKEMLSSSSARERDADERMLNTIQNEENSSKCSCGQAAPSEYEADPSCCARGTEMVFTWRKNGDMQLRIDGRLMDTFPHPEIGKGIFFEYLRGDDPMSADARDHFADGFPSLLAPLAQLKSFVPKKETSGAAHGHQQANTSTLKPKKSPKTLLKMLSNVVDDVSSRTEDVITVVHGNMNGGIANVNGAWRKIYLAAQNAGTNIQDFGTEMENLRENTWSQIIHSHEKPIRMITSRLPFLKKHLNFEEVGSVSRLEKDSDTEQSSNQTERTGNGNSNGNIFKPQIAKLLGDFNKQRPISDEIGVIIEPTMNFTHMMFLYLVHFYLVLLLIVSVPDSSTTRLVVKRSSDSTLDSDSDHEERCKQLSLDYSCSDGIGPWGEVPDGIPRFVVEKNGVEQNGVDTDLLSATTEHEHSHDEHSSEESAPNHPFKKSLSYFL